jgi:hypothetical protein
MTMTRLFMMAAAAGLALAALAGSGSAATVDIGFASYKQTGLAAALADRDSFIGPRIALAEDFETGFEVCTGQNKHTCSAGTVVSRVGTFTGYGGIHTGGDSQIKPKDKIVVKSGSKNTYGRYNVTPGGSNWLDSNDREGIRWTFTAPSDLTFRRLAFLLTDLDDVGRVVFNISVNGEKPVFRPLSATAGNGRIHLVTMLFDQPASSFDIIMVNGTGDGFGFDGARIAAVPLPAAGLMLAAALAGMAALAGRRRAA